MGQIERILNGSLELFFKAGIKSVTMDDIARHLGISKKTIYQFFADKNELVVALVKKKLKEDQDEMCAIMNKPANVVEQMVDMMKCSEEIFSRVNPAVIHDMQKYHPDAWQVFQRFKTEVVVSTFEELLTKGKEQGYIRAEVDEKIMARMRMAQVEMGFDPSVFPMAEFNPWRVQQQFHEHFNYGICTLEGYKLLEKYRSKDSAA
ncbi:TetR family transcriptional regulator [Mucilaginibacter yixingensis]|uniref:TetR family transcriptional regulator n=1 Tax=Mucilaginibacter yixingensis TaxID=1295612 RepID=A0A2T5J7J7_9SPHI|nr:TetR/AcrR family transcriptional regulator [Mucilaginibacter yixingensis]PTQ95113.1 TetR family transcriptional regulator [Mucilaginibacter yixingensis]